MRPDVDDLFELPRDDKLWPWINQLKKEYKTVGRNYRRYEDYRTVLLWPIMTKVMVTEIFLFVASVCATVYINVNLMAIPFVLGALLIPIAIVTGVSMYDSKEIDIPVKEKKSLRPKGWKKIEKEARRQKYIKDLEEELGFELSA